MKRLFRLLRSLVTLEGVPGRLRMASLAMLGALVGLLVYVARISEAASYLSDDPNACINCHIMFPEYATWEHSSHGRVTVCNDCHVPHHSLVAKYYFKAKDGLRHSALFTLRRERQVIQAIPESREVIQENCVRCHEKVVENVGLSPHGNFERSCVDCHREVPTGASTASACSPARSWSGGASAGRPPCRGRWPPSARSFPRQSSSLDSASIRSSRRGRFAWR
jgi:cytochrome c nitrite reductase small subunit